MTATNGARRTGRAAADRAAKPDVVTPDRPGRRTAGADRTDTAAKRVSTARTAGSRGGDSPTRRAAASTVAGRAKPASPTVPAAKRTAAKSVPTDRKTAPDRKTARAGSAAVKPATTRTGTSTKAATPSRAAATGRSPSRGGDERTASALAQLQRAAAAVRHHVEQNVLRAESLTWNSFVILRTVEAAQPIETRQAAAEVGLAKGTLTGVVDGLAERGLMRRVDHPDDRRLVLLELTAAGRRLMRRLLPAVQAAEAPALQRLGVTQVTTLAATLRDIADQLGTGPQR